MTKSTTNSTLTKILLLNVRDLLRQHTCGDSQVNAIWYLHGTENDIKSGQIAGELVNQLIIPEIKTD